MQSHLFTIDTEEWFQVFYADKEVPISSWDQMPARFETMIEETLDFLEARNIHATFFCLGWLAEKYPHLIRRLAEKGHEVGCHGYWHKPLPTISLQEFRDDLYRSKSVLEQAIGVNVLGYRAPGYSLHADAKERIVCISDAGFKYDSSILQSPKVPYKLSSDLWEVPPLGLRVFNSWQPAGGGFFFRAVPYILYRHFLKNWDDKNERINFYIHTWEISTQYPQVIRSPVKRFIQYYNLNSTSEKLEKLCRDFSFQSILQAYPYLDKNI